MPNVENITLLQNTLAATKDFDMNHWCGSAVCIGGWANKLQGLTPDQLTFMDSNVLEVKAAEFLGMTYGEACDLFYPSGVQNWGNITAEQAIAHLEHIKLGHAPDWSQFVDPENNSNIDDDYDDFLPDDDE